MRKIIFALIIVSILSFSFISSATLTKEEVESLKKGISINNQREIGDRTFYSIDNKGFIRLVQNNPDGSVIFETRNTRITTTGGIEITTGQSDTQVIFGNLPSSQSLFIKINGDKITIYNNDFSVDKNKGVQKFVLDNDGNFIEGSEFTLAKESTLKFFGKKYSLLPGTKITVGKEQIIFEANKEGDLTINGKKIPIKAEETTKFIVDKEGNLLEGTKFFTKNAEYVFSGYKVPLPDTAQIEYTKDKILIQVPSGSDIVPTLENADLAQKTVLEIKTKEPGFLMTPGGKFQSLARSSLGNYDIKPTSIFYTVENGKLRSYFTDEVSIFLNEQGQGDFSVVNELYSSPNPRINFAFEDTQVDMTHPTLLVTTDKIATLSAQGKGPIVNILAGNRFGVGVNKDGTNELEPGKKTLSFQSINGYAVLKKGETGKFPTLELAGNSFYGPDKKSFFGYDGNFYYNPNALIGSVNHGDGTPLLQTKLIGKDGKPINVEIFSTPENGYVFVPPGQMKSGFEYYKGSKGTIVSNSVVFNQLSPRARQLYTELLDDEQKKLYEETLKNGGIAALQSQLTQIDLQRSPLRASVDLSSCSGTLVGFIGDKPYVLTAAHCVSGQGSGRTIYLNSLKNEAYSTDEFGGRGIGGKVVAYSRRGYRYDSTKDLALIELNPGPQQLEETKRRGYVKIAPTIDYAKKGDTVLRIGCPGGTNNFRQTSCTVTGVDRTTGTDSITATKNPWGGQSGGGLFKGRYLVGVVQSGGGGWGGYGNLQSIHKMLDDFGYSQLYKLIIIFISKSKFMIILLLFHNNKK